MNAQELKDSLSVSDIITFVTVALGSDGYKEDNAGNPIFQTIDHNERGQGKYKLYYYDDKKIFNSYTAGETMDIFELTIRAGCATDFRGAFDFVSQFFGYNPWLDSQTEEPEAELTEDWNLLNKIDAISKSTEERKTLKCLSNSLVEYFPDLQPEAWRREGITVETMKKYGIRMDTLGQRIVIPHYDIEGRLIGLRGRSFFWLDLQKGAKYSPIILGEGKNFTMYNHPLGENLYGLNINKEAIQRSKQCIIYESEKSVMLGSSYYGDENCAVAVCGSSITNTQVNLILSLGVQEVIIAFDKENPSDLPAHPETMEYRNKLLRLANLFAPYANTYYLFDTFGKLNYKDSPADRGRETLEFLLQNKIFVPTHNTLSTVKGHKK